MSDYHRLPSPPVGKPPPLSLFWFRVRVSARLKWNWLRGELWCRYRHRPLIRGIGGFGGRDVWGRRRKAYSDMRCVVCGNYWDTTRAAKPLTRHQESELSKAFGDMWVGGGGQFGVGDVSEDDIDAIAETVGMGPGAWDMVDAKELIAACWTRCLENQRRNEHRMNYSK